MAFDLYLVIIDSNGAVVPGQSQVTKLRNPLRNNANVVTPFQIGSYTFGATAPITTGGGTGPVAGKVEMMELEVVMNDDANAATLFRYICAGKRFRSIDVLGVSDRGDGQSAVTTAVGVAPALLSELSWAGEDGDGPRRTLKIDGQIYSIGSATQREDGTYNPFTFATWDTAKNAGG